MTEPTQTPFENLQAEAEAPSDGSVTVHFATESGTADLVVPAPGKWKTRATRMLNQGNFEDWAQATLPDESYIKWQNLDPTNDEMEMFFTEWATASGVDLGKSRGLPR